MGSSTTWGLLFEPPDCRTLVDREPLALRPAGTTGWLVLLLLLLLLELDAFTFELRDELVRGGILFFMIFFAKKLISTHTNSIEDEWTLFHGLFFDKFNGSNLWVCSND
jgi:hypothetical protein